MDEIDDFSIRLPHTATSSKEQQNEEMQQPSKPNQVIASQQQPKQENQNRKQRDGTNQIGTKQKETEGLGKQVNEIQTSDKLSKEDTTKYNKKSQKTQQRPPIPIVGLIGLFKYAGPLDRLLVVVATIGSCAQGIGLPALFLIFGRYINIFAASVQCVPSQQLYSGGNVIGNSVLPFVYIGIGTIFTGYAVAGLTGIMGTRISRVWRTKYLEALMFLDVEFFDVESTPGTLLASLNEDTLNIEQALSQKYGSFFQFIFMFLAGVVIAIVKTWQVGLVMFAAVPGLVASLAGLILIEAGLQMKRNKLYEAADDVVQQYLTQIRTVVAYNAQSTVMKQFKDALVKPSKLGNIQGLYEGLGVGSLFLVVFGINALGWWFGGDRLRRGIVQSPGDVLTAIFAIIIGGFSLGQIAPSLIYFNRGVAAKIRMQRTIEHTPRIDSRKGGKEVEDIVGDVELVNVSFAYPARPDFLVFKNFSLKIDHGNTVALVGQSGSGKSTIVQLVQRFYDPTYGQILIDGLDLKQYQLRSIRNHIGLVNQEPILFSGTIGQNILQGKLGSNQEEMIQAAKNANVHQFIDTLPQKYNTSVGSRGVSLSGGQKQRIAIARAMLKNPKILLLDEATSALDNKSERIVQDALNKLSVGRTTIVVAHRLSTIRSSNMIAVIREGQMVELGSHEELIQKPDGFYTNLVKIQMATGDLEIDQDKQLLEKEEMNRKAQQEDLMQAEAEINKEESKKNMLVHRLSISMRQIESVIPQSSVRMLGGQDYDISQRRTNDLGGDYGSKRSMYASSKKMDQGTQTQEKKKGLFGFGGGKKKQKEKSKGTFGRMMKINAPEWPFLLVAVIASIIVGAGEPIQAVLIPRALFSLLYSRAGFLCRTSPDFCPCPQLAEIQAGTTTPILASQAILAKYKALNLTVVYVYVGLSGGVALMAFLQKAAFSYMGQQLAERMRELLMNRIMSQEIGFFDYTENSVGALASRLSTDALLIKGAVGDSVGAILQQVTTAIGCLVIAFVAGGSAWKLSLVVLAALPLFAVAISLQQSFNFGLQQGTGDNYTLANNIATESAFNIRIIHSFNLEYDVKERYTNSLNDAFKSQIKQANVNGVTNGIANFLQFGVNALGLWYGGLLLSRRELNVQQLFQAFFGITFIGQGIANAQILFPDVAKSGPAASRIYEIVDRKPLIDSDTDQGEKLKEVKGRVEYKNIQFVYPTRQEVTVFQDFSLLCEAGQTTAMVGESGSGKSTVISLLERFYDPQKGSVYLDGINIQKLNLKWLRGSIALVSQEPVLFNAPLIDNIRIGRADTTVEEALKACEIANISDFVNNLPQKLDTPIGERGIRLSGGQKQRIAIARAIVKNSKILLLDEATSALDANSEHVVQEALDRISVNRTTITIAHRLSTIRHADKIAVVQRGKLVEQGTHEQLVKIPDGVYNGLVKAQEKKA